MAVVLAGFQPAVTSIVSHGQSVRWARRRGARAVIFPKDPRATPAPPETTVSV
jgi:hypothetical protein